MVAGTIGQGEKGEKLVILVDGDNTLWDTNKVFEEAQRAALATLAAHGFDLGKDGFSILREADIERDTSEEGKHGRPWIRVE